MKPVMKQSTFLWAVAAILGIYAMLGLAQNAGAFNELATYDGNVGHTTLVVVQESTSNDATQRAFGTQQLRSDRRGRLHVTYTMEYSSYSSVRTAATTKTYDGDVATPWASTQAVVLSRNPNVLCVGSSSEPATLGKLWVQSNSGNTPIRIQFFDTRGATDTNKVWDMTVSSSPQPITFDLDFSSGITLHKDGDAATTVTFRQSKQK